MELMKKVILGACFSGIIITIADMLKPGEKFTGQMRLIFSLVFICSVLKIIAGSGYDGELELSFDAENISAYEDISDAANQEIKLAAQQSLEESIMAVLDENGVEYEKITADINIEEDSCISINEIGYKGPEPERAAELIRENTGDAEVREID